MSGSRIVVSRSTFGDFIIILPAIIIAWILIDICTLWLFNLALHCGMKQDSGIDMFLLGVFVACVLLAYLWFTDKNDETRSHTGDILVGVPNAIGYE